MAKYTNEIHNEINTTVNVSGKERIFELERDLQSAREEVDSLSSELQNARERAVELHEELDSFKSSHGIDILQEELERFRDTASQSLTEFKNFLQAVNLNDVWGSNDHLFDDIFDRLRDGLITTSQAVTEVKSNFSHLMEENYSRSGGLFDSQMVQSFTATLEHLGDVVNSVVDKLNNIETNGIKAIGDGGGGGVGNIASVFDQLKVSAENLPDSLRDSYAAITGLVTALNEYASLDSTKLLGVSQAFRNIADIGKGSFGTKSIENIVRLARELQGMTGNGGFRFDFTGLNDVNVRKTSLDNLATYLPRLAEIKMGKLERLSKIDLTNFNNIKVSSSSIKNLMELADVYETLDEISRKIGLKNSGTPQDTGVEDAIAGQQKYRKEVVQTNTALQDQIERWVGIQREPGAFAESREDISRTFVAGLVRMDEQEAAAREASAALEDLEQRERAAAQAAFDSAPSLRSQIDEMLGIGREAKSAKESFEVFKEQYEVPMDPTAIDKARKTISDTQIQIQKFLDGSTAARTGRGAGLYQEIEAIKLEFDSLDQELLKGLMTPSQYAERLAELKLKFAEASNGIKELGENHKTAGDRFKEAISKFSQWFSATRIVMAVWREIKKMITNVVELDTAMTELRKVTDESEDAYDRFLNRAGDRARELGTTIKDIVNSSADFARLGFTLSEAEELSNAATIYKNVGDGISDISEASESIISTMKAFGVEAENSMTIVDKFNEVGNNFAISSQGVGEALQRSASALASANNTIDESIALVTTANTVVQNPQSVGTAMKTLSMYLRAAKTEAEDAGESTEGMASSVSELRKSILDLTGQKVDIMLDKDTFKSTYQIIGELSKIWNQISDVSQANILEMIGGKRNANVVSALLNNFDIAESVLEKSVNSLGSATKENEKYLDSIQGRVNQLKATFEELSTNFINGDFAKGVVDAGAWLLNVLNKIIPALGGISNILLTIGSLAIINNFGSIIKRLDKATVGIRYFGITLVDGFKKAINAESGFFKALGSGISNAIAEAGLLKVAISSAVVALAVVDMIRDKIERDRQAAIEAAQAEADAQKEIVSKTNSLISAYSEYEKYNNITDRTISEEEKLTAALADVKDALGSKIEKLSGLKEGTEDYTNALKEQIKVEMESRALAAKEENVAAEKALELRYKDAKIVYGQTSKRYSGSNEKIYGIIEKIFSGFTGTDTFTLDNFLGVFGGGAPDTDLTISPPRNADEIVSYYYKLITLRDTLAESFTAKELKEMDVYSNVTGAIDSLKTDVERVVQSEFDSAVTNAISIYGIPETSEAYDRFKESVLNSVNQVLALPAETAKPIIDAMFEADGMFSSIENGLDSIGAEGGVQATRTLSGFAEALEKLKSNYDLLNTAQKEMDETGSISADTIKKLADETDKYGDYIYEQDGLVKLNTAEWKIYSQELYKASVNMDEGSESAEIINAAIENIMKSASSASKTISEFVGALKKVNSVSDEFGMLDKIYADIINGEEFDFASLIGDDFTAAFSQYGEAYSNFIETVANSPDDIEKCQDAFDRLAGELLNNTEALDGVTDATRDATVKMLEQMGVANAAEVVDARLAYTKEKLKYTTGEYADATYEQIDALYKEQEAGSLTQQVLGELLTEKMRINAEQIRTTSDIDQLIALANAAGASAEYLAKCAEAKVLLAEAGNLDDYMTDYRRKYALVNQARALLGADPGYAKFNPEDFRASYTGGSSSSSARDSAEKEAQKSAEKVESWFEKQYKEHQHLVAMEQENNKEYLDWLAVAYKKAYSEGIIELDDYRKYQEEVFSGLRNLFEEHTSRIERDISMREGFDEQSKNIVNLYKGLMKDVEAEIAAAKAQGLSESSTYIQELESQWLGYQKSINDIYEDITNNAKDALDDLVDVRIDMLKQEIEDEKDALNERLDRIKDFYQKQKDLMHDQYDEEKYLKEQAEKAKNVTDIRNEMARLAYDDSAWARKRMLELADELADAETELSDFERQHSLDVADATLAKYQEAQEKDIEDEIALLDKKLNDPKALYEQALQDIRAGSIALYEEMIDWNAKYGDGITETITNKWNEAYGALSEYALLYGALFNGVKLPNSAGYTPNLMKGIPGYASGTRSASAGLHRINEYGNEAIFQTADGSKYRLFNGGEMVLNAKASNFLYDFANGGAGFLKSMTKNLFGGIMDSVSSHIGNNQIRMGDIIIQGDAGATTVSEIRRAQRDSLSEMLKALGKLNK